MTRFTPTPSARHGWWPHLTLAAIALIGIALLGWWVVAGASRGQFSVSTQVVDHRAGRDAIDTIPLPSPLRDGNTSSELPRFHVYLGTPAQAAAFFHQQLPAQGFVLEREWSSRDNAMFQTWRRGNTLVAISMQAPYSGPPQPTRISLDVSPSIETLPRR